ncbi:hypothetical protein KZ813_04145 [Sphingomonas sp. RHCKR7]|uniref:hypothetical protein n=1 Tax=Sphingomonas folli TaxID=2862497 RepID=UPI001CA553E6|nr:hypothetical protein [Sphingomonas folli]MBW6526020.1 hypothetical protein [Sphingomonas folli]
MYSDSDLDQAVTAGVMPPQIAAAFRDHVAALRATPAVDEEHFRFLTGFNDIFVTIAITLLLVAVAQIGGVVADWAGGAAVAATSWALALYFTARRRMALPSIVLLLTFVGGVAAAVLMAADSRTIFAGDRTGAMTGSAAAGLAAIGAWAHWRRFHVPITPAAGAAAGVGLVISLILAALPAAEHFTWAMLLVGGVAVFGYAMRWDMSDPRRETRRADVAFWLHLVAAPMIAHPVFRLLGVFEDQLALGTALIVLLLYLLSALVALAVDRRALLVSSLIYVLYALSTLIRTSGAVELSAALTALVIGAALLSLSAFWQTIRAALVQRLGAAAHRLPPVHHAG